MASIIGHAAVAYALSKALPHSAKKNAIVTVGVLASMLPDLDVLSFKFGIAYESPLGHRGFTHSLLFAILLGLVLMAVFKKYGKQWLLFLYFFLCTASHGILDACTTGGRGVGFLIPFKNDRYFFPWQVIKVSPLGVEKFFSKWGLEVLLSEFIWIGLPCLLFVLMIKLLNTSK
ncbi:MAG: metal-dependent hydrolase [Saprospiraceae bacterium]|nr:metal-dependent hydrolase [Saprospiraceae bacterium]